MIYDGWKIRMRQFFFFFLPIVILSFVKMKENSEMEFMFPTETTEKKVVGQQ